MTAKHRKGKNNHKHEDNFFKDDVMESEVRAAGNSYTFVLVLILVVVVGGAIGAWVCFQQHQTLTYLTDNVMGIQMKIAKLQSSHEDLRQSSGKHISESLESRLNALEESYLLAQKQVGMALATAEQLKTSDLPAQVLSLHTEMKTRLTEMQQATVSTEQLGQVQSLLQGKTADFEEVRLQVEALAALNDGLSLKLEALESSLGEAESKLAQKVATLSASLNGQAAEVLSLKEQLEEASVRREAPETTVEETLFEATAAAAAEVVEQTKSTQDNQAPEEVVDVTEEEPAAQEEHPVEEMLEEPASEEPIHVEEEAVEKEEAENEAINVEVSEAEEMQPEEDEDGEMELADLQDIQPSEEGAQEVEDTPEDTIKEEEERQEQQPADVAEEVSETEEVLQESTEDEMVETQKESPEVHENETQEEVLEDSLAQDSTPVEKETVLEEEQVEVTADSQDEQAEPQVEDDAPLEDVQDGLLEDK